MGVTKTDFVRGLQCPKMLWLDSHKPLEKIIPEAVQKRLDEGNEFGDQAMGLFGEYVETTGYRADGRLDYKKCWKRPRGVCWRACPSFARRRFRGTEITARRIS